MIVSSVVTASMSADGALHNMSRAAAEKRSSCPTRSARPASTSTSVAPGLRETETEMEMDVTLR